jgi:hypothetical protein
MCLFELISYPMKFLKVRKKIMYISKRRMKVEFKFMEIFSDMKHADRLTNTVSPLHVYFMFCMQIVHRSVNRRTLLAEACLYEVRC